MSIQGIEERDRLDHTSKAQKVLRMPEGLAAIGKGQPLLRTDILSPCRDPDLFFLKEKKNPRFSCEVSFFKNIDKESNSSKETLNVSKVTLCSWEGCLAPLLCP